MRSNKDRLLNDAHWKSLDYKQRMESKSWKLILLDNDDIIIFQGKTMKLKAKSIGFGVVEVYKAELTDPWEKK